MLRIDICICTFQRPHLARTLASLDAMERPEETDIRVIVADNDDTQTGRDIIDQTPPELPITYIHAPARNISIARNACLDAADADWIAFIDDDEVATKNWLQALLSRANATKADGVFGPALAIYGPDAPAWMVAGQYHSNIPQERAGVVQTGHTCNALLRWADTTWKTELFDLALGKTGGEDTDFFFRLYRMGARFALAPDAHVHEDVSPVRMSFRWLWARKFRSGQAHVASASGFTARLTLACKAAAKASASAIMALVHITNQDKRVFWVLRSALHLGVCAGCLSVKGRAHYGN